LIIHHKNDIKLNHVLQGKPVNELEEAVEFDEKKLKLVCVDFVSKV